MPPRLSALVLLAASLWVLLNLRWCLFVVVRHVTPLRKELEQLLEEAQVDGAIVDVRDDSSHSRPPGVGRARQNAKQRVGGSAQPTAKSRVQPAQRPGPSQTAGSGVAPHSAREPYLLTAYKLLGMHSVSGGDGGRSGGSGGGSGGGTEERRAPSVGGDDGGGRGGDGDGGGASEPNPDDAAAAILASKCARGDMRACSNRVEVPINSDFDLLAELSREEFAVSPARRIELMMSRYQTRPIFGIIENKLLAHSLLHALGVPQLPMEYGALARHQLGEWATLDEPKMNAALQRVHAMPRGAVIKAATDGGSANILLLTGFGKLPNGSLQFRVDRHDGTRWRRFKWATEAVVSQVHAMLAPGRAAPSARWRQRFEHRGVLLQQRYRCAQHECSGHQLLELKVHVVFGRISCFVAERVPVRFDDSIYVSIADDGSLNCWRNETGRTRDASDKFDCANLLPLVTAQLSRLSDAGANIAAALLADWFRMDLFLGHPQLELRVNEITYPSHILDTGALHQWLRKYHELQIRAISGVSVYRRVSEIIGLDNSTFWDADGAALRSYEATDPTGADKRTRYIMAYSRDEASATAKDLFKLPATARGNHREHLKLAG